MRAIILAAGRGSRMKERTDILPKCLTRLWGKSLLEWQIEALSKTGIKDIAIITGYRSEEIRKRQPELHYFHNEKWAETNMVATLMEGKEWLEEDDCIVSYSDILYTSDAVSSLSCATSGVSLAYYTEFLSLWKRRFENPLEDIETFRLDGESCLLEIGQRASSLEEIEGQYMGLLKFTPEGWKNVKKMMDESMPKPIDKIDMTGVLSHLLSKGMRIEAVPYRGVWLEVDSLSDLELYKTWKGTAENISVSL